MYAQNATGQWYSFSNGQWQAIADSADGASIVPSNDGSLITKDGMWTFGTSTVAGVGNTILLDGVQAAGGVGTKLEVANGGVLYTQNAAGQWHSFSKGQWQVVANSADGTSIVPSSSGSLVTKDGIWTFGTSTVAGIGNTILLNGVSADGGIGTKLEVANGGTLYTQNASGQWYTFSNGQWQAVADSSDGASIVPSSNGSLVTKDGIWTFGTSTVAGIGNTILLNGVQADGGIGTKLEVANGGTLYTQNASGRWYTFSNGQWQTVADSADSASIVSSTGGSLITKDGIWTFGTSTVAGIGNTILLNGVQAAGGIGTTLEIAHGGVLYAQNASGQWYSFGNGQWQALADLPTVPRLSRHPTACWSRRTVSGPSPPALSRVSATPFCSMASRLLAASAPSSRSLMAM